MHQHFVINLSINLFQRNDIHTDKNEMKCESVQSLWQETHQIHTHTQRERERERERERDLLFNDALNTFYLRLYGVRHMVKNHSDSEKGNPLPPHRLLLSIKARVLLYAPSHRQDNTYHGLCYTSRGALAGTKNSSMGRYTDTEYPKQENLLV